MTDSTKKQLCSPVAKTVFVLSFMIAAFATVESTAVEFEDPTFYPVGVNPGQLAIADFDGLGDLDVAVVNSGIWPNGTGTLSVLLGNGDGTLSEQDSYPLGVIPVGLSVGDLNNDTFPDLVVVNRQPFLANGTVQVF